MSRFFNGKEIELLAPCGNFEIFTKLVATKCDSIYFGGLDFNMRMHRKDFNFSNEDIKNAIELGHKNGKKIFITLNNLMSQKNMENLPKFLDFLEEVQPDALIVQDFGVLKLLEERKSKIKIHSSVMMNVHNLETIKTLEKLGVTRVVTARELSLAQIKYLNSVTNMEYEYFVHGDMCVAQGAHCLYSGVLFGKSGNRGLCFKPCRWDFKLKYNENLFETEFPLAARDMSLYEYIPNLIEAGVTSFKIEGRMRDADYLTRIINNYSEAIDRYISEPLAYSRDMGYSELFDNRNRDHTTAYAFGNPGLDYINRRYEGTGKFFSTGKVFSKATPEILATTKRMNEIKEVLKCEGKLNNKKPKLSVKVNDFKSAKLCIEKNIDVLYLSGEVFQPAKPFSTKEINELCEIKNKTKIYLGLPKMMYETEFMEYNHYLQNNKFDIDGLLVTNLGALTYFKKLGYEVVGDFSLNIYNTKSMEFYKNKGLRRGTLSIESPLHNTNTFFENVECETEFIIHGKPVVMFLEHDLYQNMKMLEPTKVEKESSKPNVLYLVDEKNVEHPVYRDYKGKNHITLVKELCYLPIVSELSDLGVDVLRIEAVDYSVIELEKLIDVYKNSINNTATKNTEDFEKMLEMNQNYTFGSLDFN